MSNDPISPGQRARVLFVMAALLCAYIVVGGMGLAGLLPLWPGFVVLSLMMALGGWLPWREYRVRRAGRRKRKASAA